MKHVYFIADDRTKTLDSVTLPTSCELHLLAEPAELYNHPPGLVLWQTDSPMKQYLLYKDGLDSAFCFVYLPAKEQIEQSSALLMKEIAGLISWETFIQYKQQCFAALFRNYILVEPEMHYEMARLIQESKQLNRPIRILRLQEENVPAFLTDKEKKVLLLLADGLGTQEIADKLYYSPKTIRGYFTRLLRKTGNKSRTDLVVQAYREKWVEAE
ncbi:response regulator transcription factor [Alkalicoccus urumqiensis]|uniref:HTH luxR-type domain-containing protein n=1 Tax=Alkalicoccus urumqiensis TaxID=1548213 RepID=A0A2P6MII2_ALKUR|nr:LuxR C-terminal-related transcriptional regulator [Alkalicoccus urumqiensis]PRO66089.1 hypothetical protein C6I21_07265 [Alkalicoccus urumqiensis]